MRLPSTTMSLPSAVTSPGNLPWTLSCLNSQALDLASARSLIADQLEPAVGPLEDRAGDQPADPPEAVDCNFGHAISLCFMMVEHARGDLVRRQPEIFVGVLGRGRDAEAVDADAQAVKPGVALPAEGRPGLDRHAQDLAVGDVGQDVLAIVRRLRVEALGARHGHDVGADPLRFKPLGDGERDLDLGAGGDQDRPCAALRRALSR